MLITFLYKSSATNIADGSQKHHRMPALLCGLWDVPFTDSSGTLTDERVPYDGTFDALMCAGTLFILSMITYVQYVCDKRKKFTARFKETLDLRNNQLTAQLSGLWLDRNVPR